MSSCLSAISFSPSFNLPAISFGRIDRGAQVTSGVHLQAKDGRHQFTLDNDGVRKASTTSTCPGKFQIRSGTDNSGKIISDKEETLSLIADNGNITIVASNGKIRLQANDIEMIADHSKGDKGNIRMYATESIQANCKKFLVSSSLLYRISTVGLGEIFCMNPSTPDLYKKMGKYSPCIIRPFSHEVHPLP